MTAGLRVRPIQGICQKTQKYAWYHSAAGTAFETAVKPYMTLKWRNLC